MEDNIKKKRNWLTGILALFFISECLVWIGIMINDPLVENQEIKLQIIALLDTDRSLDSIQSIHTKRFGPVTFITLSYFSHNQTPIEASLTQWLGFKPKLKCVAVQTVSTCQ